MTWGSSIFATVTAVNNMGASLTSDEGNGGIILAIPLAPLNLRDRPAITTSTQIGLAWDAVPVSDQGGTDVIDYTIFMAVLPNAYSIVGTGITTTTFTAEDLTPGTTYSFKIQSRNLFGNSLDSTPVVSILAAQMPDRPAAPTTSLSGTSLTIDWNAPFDQGKEIDYYKIYILKSDLTTYSLELNDCDGSNPSIVSSTSCVIDVLILRSAPFSLPWGTKVYAKVIAHNSYGDSQESLPGAGDEGVIMTYPDAPTTLTEVVSSRAADSITFTWVDGTYNNGAVVTSYRISMSQGAGTYSELKSLHATREYTATGLTAG